MTKSEIVRSGFTASLSASENGVISAGLPPPVTAEENGLSIYGGKVVRGADQVPGTPGIIVRLKIADG